MQVITPPEIVEVNKPVIFLAGPIQGARDWQSEAIELIGESYTSDDIIVASPRRQYLDKEFDYDAQTDWEVNYLNKAGLRNGVIMFWLAKEETPDPKRAFAQTSRFELARYHAWGANVVVGIEDGFSGERYIRKYIETGERPIYSTLEETIGQAMDCCDYNHRLLREEMEFVTQVTFDESKFNVDKA